jgi:NADH-quinone oxidoreductase subunit M
VSFPLLSAIIFLPLLGGIMALLLPRRIAWGCSLLFSFGELVLATILGLQFQNNNSGFQFAEHQLWIPGLGINYSLGVDGISLFLIILTALLTAVVIGISPLYLHGNHPKSYYFLMLVLSTGIQGVFLATNLFLFYVFWEIMLVPAYLLIGIFGGNRRTYAAIKFVIYTAIGSLLMLAAIIGIGVVVGNNNSLDIATLVGKVPPDSQMILFLAFFAAFAVKSPLFPFHSWLPDAYSEAPIPVTIMLAGAMSKTGTYGFLRYGLGLFPDAMKQAAPSIVILIIIGILYGAILALTQSDFKRLLAYSSISHVGVILLGIFALNTQGIEGAIMQMVNHGITTSALFLVAGAIELRLGTRSIHELGGLATRLPILSIIFCIAALSSLGLPGLNSFAGEFLALLGAFQANMAWGILGTLVVIPAAWYLLRFFQGIMEGIPPQKTNEASGEEKKDSSKISLPLDLSLGEIVAFIPLIALMILIGLFPSSLPNHIEPSVTPMISTLVSPSTSATKL